MLKLADFTSRLTLLFALESLVTPLFFMFTQFYSLIISIIPDLSQYVFLAFTIILILFIIISTFLTHQLSKFFRELEDIRLQNAVTLVYIAIILIIVSPFIPFLGFTLVIWGSVLMFLILGLLVTGIGRNYYDNSLTLMGIITAVVSLFILNPLGFAVISTFIFVSGLKIGKKISSFALRSSVSEFSDLVEKEILEACREEKVVELSSIGIKYGIPRSLLVNLLERIKDKDELDIYIISGSILCRPSL